MDGRVELRKRLTRLYSCTSSRQINTKSNKKQNSCFVLFFCSDSVGEKKRKTRKLLLSLFDCALPPLETFNLNLFAGPQDQADVWLLYGTSALSFSSTKEKRGAR